MKKSVAKGNVRQPGRAAKSISRNADKQAFKATASGNRGLSGTPGGTGNAMKSGTP